MKNISLVIVLTSLVVLGMKIESFFGGMFVVHYNEGVYSLEWLEDYVSEVREGYGLKTDFRFVQGLKEAVDRAALKTGLDPLLIIAIISVESGFRNVMGMAGELGMMQIKPETAEFVSKVFSLPRPEEGWKELLWNYELNILYGAHYLKFLLDKFGDLKKAVEYYNGGSKKEIYAEMIFKVYHRIKSGG